MITILRHLLSILFLPFMVVVAIPVSLLNGFAAFDSHWEESVLWPLVGGIFLLAGLTLFSWCVRLFAKVGRGTLAPWDPTTNMVAVGPYRYVRNPMISSVALVLIGEAVFRGSWILGLWAGVFILINHLYFVLSKEPGLEKRFGEAYHAFKATVPRWLPRIKPNLDEPGSSTEPHGENGASS